jgi:hypothetical protein
MPNHIQSYLTIKTDDESRLNEILDFLKNDEVGRGSIDFNKITPTPPWVFQDNLGKEHEEKWGIENCWYEWSRTNWGTKWNAYQSGAVAAGVNTIRFQTAWNGVAKLMIKLSMIFRDVEFDYGWADEDTGQNVGEITFKDFKVIKENIPKGGTKEAYEMCFRIKDHWPKCYRYDEGEGTYVYDEDLDT